MSSQNLPVIMATDSAALNLPATTMAEMSALFDMSFQGLGGATMRRIKVRKTDFVLIDGGSQEIVQGHELCGVFVGAAPHNHATWYEKDYKEGSDNPPDLTWIMPDMNTFPDALPMQFRKKVIIGGQERWAFQIARRVAFVLVRNVNGQMIIDVDKPYVMDLSSMSLFGKGLPEHNMYKWGGIRDLCNQHSTANTRIFPSMFMTQIVIDPNTPVSGVVMFKPMRDQNGRLAILDGGIIQQVHACAQAQATRDMLVIREKLTYGGNTTAPAQAFTAPPTGAVADPAFLQTIAPSAQASPPVMPVQSQPAPAVQGIPGMSAFNTVQPTHEQAMVAQPASVVTAPQPVVPSEMAGAGGLLDMAQAILTSPAPSAPAQPAAPLTMPVPQAEPAAPNVIPQAGLEALKGLLQ